MICSMTGYGRAVREMDGIMITVEIRSVNHRYIDYHIRLPQTFMKLEEKIKKVCQKYISRGRLDCYIKIDGTNLTNRSLHIDWELLDDYYQFVNCLKERYNIKENIGLSAFLHKQDLISIVEQEEDLDEIDELILSTVEEAVQNLKNMRIMEGKALESELRNYVEKIENFISLVEQIAPQVKENYEEKLRNRLNEYTNGMFDESRVLTEVAVFAERCDISEELTRLRSHLNQFRLNLDANIPVGRKLDFIVQEMNREVNTIASKANDREISLYVVELKSLLEKIREQIQNIE